MIIPTPVHSEDPELTTLIILTSDPIEAPVSSPSVVPSTTSEPLTEGPKLTARPITTPVHSDAPGPTTLIILTSGLVPSPSVSSSTIPETTEASGEISPPSVTSGATEDSVSTSRPSS